MQKLDWIFDGDYVVILCLVDQIDNRGQCRALTTPGRACHEHYAILYVNNLFQLYGQVKVAKVWRVRRNHAHNDRMAAALFENIHTKSRFTGSAKGEIRRTTIF